MPNTIILCDWMTVTGGSGQVVVQAEAQWPRLTGVQDFAVYTEISSLTSTNATNIDIQCSPTKDPTFFDNASQTANAYAIRYALTNTLTTGLQAVRVCRFATATDQLPAEYVRWKITFPSGGTTNCTIRMTLNVLKIL